MGTRKQPPFHEDIVQDAFESLGASTVAQVIAHTGLLPNAVRASIRTLRSKNKLYVTGFVPFVNGIVAVYACGAQSDAIDPRIAKRHARQAHEAEVVRVKAAQKAERERLKAEKEYRKQKRDEEVHKRHKTPIIKNKPQTVCDIAASWMFNNV